MWSAASVLSNLVFKFFFLSMLTVRVVTPCPVVYFACTQGPLELLSGNLFWRICNHSILVSEVCVILRALSKPFKIFVLFFFLPETTEVCTYRAMSQVRYDSVGISSTPTSIRVTHATTMRKRRKRGRSSRPMYVCTPWDRCWHYFIIIVIINTPVAEN